MINYINCFSDLYKIYNDNISLTMLLISPLSALPLTVGARSAMIFPMSLIEMAPVFSMEAFTNFSNSSLESCSGKYFCKIVISAFH